MQFEWPIDEISEIPGKKLTRRQKKCLNRGKTKLERERVFQMYLEEKGKTGL